MRPLGAGILPSKLGCSERAKSDLTPVLERRPAGGGQASAVRGSRHGCPHGHTEWSGHRVGTIKSRFCIIRVKISCPDHKPREQGSAPRVPKPREPLTQTPAWLPFKLLVEPQTLPKPLPTGLGCRGCGCAGQPCHSQILGLPGGTRLGASRGQLSWKAPGLPLPCSPQPRRGGSWRAVPALTCLSLMMQEVQCVANPQFTILIAYRAPPPPPNNLCSA